jgi:aldose 1-epimerase
MEKIFKGFCCVGLMLMVVSGCSSRSGSASLEDNEKSNVSVTREHFGTLADGREVQLFTIQNGNGMTVKAINYGGIITSILVPDKEGKSAEVVLGFDSLTHYTGRHPHVGPMVGRYSGYVANGKFSIDGVEYTLAKNSGANHLHGGLKAFDKILWNASEIRNENGSGIELSYTSPDGEEGYPGNLEVKVSYIVTENNSLEITYEAETDKKTHVNLTNHLYFNLSGMEGDDVLQHVLQINASHYAVPGDGNIPTGELRTVEGTALGFLEPQAIGSRIGDLQNGYDHNYVLKRENNDQLLQAATVYDPTSGRVMEVQTTHTGLEFASADWLNVSGRSRRHFGKRSGFLLYPQHLPDSPNRPDFPSTILEPGYKYRQKTIYSFSVKNG